ncbi:hypothetical protein Xekj_00645 [Xenorhabdus sp. KJ12.1]|nr:hypothetical protein Xekj_00645 [Xenorhabdus sp. KJ12.1]
MLVISFHEIINRILIVKDELYFKRPVITNEIIVSSRITEPRNRTERLKIISMNVDVAQG